MTTKEFIALAREEVEHSKKSGSVSPVVNIVVMLVEALESEIKTSLRLERVIHEQSKIIEDVAKELKK